MIPMYATLDVAIHTVQGCRIRCEGCCRPYTVLSERLTTGRSRGLPLLDDAALTRLALESAAAQVLAGLRERRRGSGACPHCGHLQSWMRRSRALESIAGTVRAALLGGVAGVIAGLLAWIKLGSVASGISPHLITVCGVVATLAVGALKHVRSRAPGASTGDPRSMADDELDAFVAAREQRGDDPWLAWARTAGVTEGDHAVLASIGFVDHTGEDDRFDGRHAPEEAFERSLGAPRRA